MSVRGTKTETRSSNSDHGLILLLQNTSCGPGEHVHHLHTLLSPASPMPPVPSAPSGPVPGLSEDKAPDEGGTRPGLPLAAALLRSGPAADLQRGHKQLHRSVSWCWYMTQVTWDRTSLFTETHPTEASFCFCSHSIFCMLTDTDFLFSVPADPQSQYPDPAVCQPQDGDGSLMRDEPLRVQSVCSAPESEQQCVVA